MLFDGLLDSNRRGNSTSSTWGSSSSSSSSPYTSSHYWLTGQVPRRPNQPSFTTTALQTVFPELRPQPSPRAPSPPPSTTMPLRRRAPRPAMYNTPAIRTGGFGALQVEAVTNRPLSIARRHLAASQLRMRDIEPDELSSSQWVQFLVMEERERERWMADFVRRRNTSSGSSSRCGSAGSGSPSSSAAPRTADPELAYDKAEEAAEEARDAARQQAPPVTSPFSSPDAAPTGSTPAVSAWVRHYDGDDQDRDPARFVDTRPQSPPYEGPRPRPMHARHAVTDAAFLNAAPPTYESAMRARTPPPAYVPRGAAGAAGGEEEEDLYGSS